MKSMINAIIYHGENTLILELPRSVYDIHEKLMSIGCPTAPGRIPLTDNEDDALRVKLYGRIEMGNHFLKRGAVCVLSACLVHEHLFGVLFLRHFQLPRLVLFDGGAAHIENPHFFVPLVSSVIILPQIQKYVNRVSIIFEMFQNL